MQWSVNSNQQSLFSLALELMFKKKSTRTTLWTTCDSMAAVKVSVSTAHLTSLSSRSRNAEGDNIPSLGCGKRSWETCCGIFQSLLAKPEMYWEISKAKALLSRRPGIPGRLWREISLRDNATVVFNFVTEVKTLRARSITLVVNTDFSSRHFLLVSYHKTHLNRWHSTTSGPLFTQKRNINHITLLLLLDTDLGSLNLLCA